MKILTHVSTPKVPIACEIAFRELGHQRPNLMSPVLLFHGGQQSSAYVQIPTLTNHCLDFII